MLTTSAVIHHGSHLLAATRQWTLRCTALLVGMKHDLEHFFSTCARPGNAVLNSEADLFQELT
jgi:hypothetical protein